MDRRYYNQYFQLERTHWWFLARKKILETQIKKLVKIKRNIKILNTGVSTGATTEMLKKYGEVISLELDEFCCHFLEEKLKIPVVNASITEIPFGDNSFDLVCAFDVIEHVEDDQLAISEMERVCKPNGNIFITVPAFMNLWSKHDLINHHFRRYTLTTLEKILKKNTHIHIIYKSYFNTLLFIPISVIRKILGSPKNYQTQEVYQSDFNILNYPILNNLLYCIFYTENLLLRNRQSLPFGVSIMVILKKN